MRNIALNQGVVLVGAFLEQEGFLFGEIFFPTEINCRYVFNSFICIFVCVWLNQIIPYKNNKTCVSGFLTM